MNHSVKNIISQMSIHYNDPKVTYFEYYIIETPLDVRSGDTVFAVYSYVAETDEAINLVEGERLYILGKTKIFYLYKYEPKG